MGWNNRYDIKDAINSSGVMKDDTYYWGIIVSIAFWAWTFGSIEDFLGNYMRGGLAGALTGVLMFGWLLARIIYGEIATGVVYLVGIIMLVCQIAF